MRNMLKLTVMKSKLVKLLPIFFLGLFLWRWPLLAQEKFTVYFFYGRYCPHCAQEEEFLEKLEGKYDFLEVKRFEVTENRDNSQLLEKVAARLSLDVRGIPFTVVHEQTFTGYLNDETTGKEIEAAINRYREEGCADPIADLFPQDGQGAVESEDCEEKTSFKDLTISLPFIGQIKAQDFSLPVLTILIAGVDGFNPCAMWVLLFLISLLLGMKNRQKMWLLGGTFIFSSALVYFLFLSAWLNLFLFIGFISWVRLLIGAVALGSGFYYLRGFWVNRLGECKVVGQEKKQKIMTRLRQVTQEKKLLIALLGIVLLAFAVNLIELVCSAGLPAVYTQILSLGQFSAGKYYLYLLLYIFIFMLDDLIVFWVAMTSLNAIGATGKYSRYSNLIGGLIVFILGALLIFKPDWLMFG